MAKKKAEYVPPTSQVDLERRLSDDYRSPLDISGSVSDPDEVNAPYAVEDNDTSAYIGVSPEYMTYANETEKPLNAQKGVLKKLEEKARQGSAVGEVAPRESKQTLGGGSNRELVYSATSGEDFTAEKVDRAALAKEQESSDEEPEDEENNSTPDVTAPPIQTS